MRLSPRHRGALAATSLVLGLVCVFGSAVALYLRDNVHDRRGFAANVVQSFQDEGVASYVGAQVATQVVAAYEDLIAAQSALDQLLPVVLASDVAAPVVYRAAEDVHETLFDPGGDSYVLDLADIGSLVASILQVRGIAAADSVPTDLRGAFVTIAETEPVALLVRMAEKANLLAFVLPPVALALLALCLVLARNRRRAAAWMGIGIGACGLLLWIGAQLIESTTLGRLEDSDIEDAARGVLDAFLGGVGTWALVLGAVGAVIAAAAVSAFSGAEVNARVGAAWRLVTTTPEREWLRALRAVVLVALGLFVAFRHELALTVVFAATGFYLVLIGLSELVRQLELLSSRGAEASGGRSRIVAWTVAAVGIAAVVVAVVLTLARGPDVEEAAAAPAETGCNGHVELCDRPLNEVAFATAHNAMSAAASQFTNPNQPRGIVAQLDAGIRGFLIDAYNGSVGDRGHVITSLTAEARDSIVDQVGEKGLTAVERLLGKPLDVDAPLPDDAAQYLCHVVCEIGATPMAEELTEVKDWLEEHPREVVVVFIQDEGVTPEQVERVFGEAGLLDLVYEHEAGAPWPTLGELIDLGQRVVVLAEHVGAPGTWYHQGFDLVQETPYDNKTVEALRSDESCAPNRGGTAGDLFLLNHWVARYPPRPSDARTVNAHDFLLDRARRCEAIRGLAPNLVAVDFYDRGDLVAVVDELNGVGE
jgi:hypothetical protein